MFGVEIAFTPLPVLSVCCWRIVDVDARSRFVAETTEGEAATYVGVVAVVLIAIPIFLMIVMDVITCANPNTVRKRRTRLRSGRSSL